MFCFCSQQMSNFEENFYLVVLERLSSKMGDEGSRLHMWKITASSTPTHGPCQPHDSNGNNLLIVLSLVVIFGLLRIPTPLDFH